MEARHKPSGTWRSPDTTVESVAELLEQASDGIAIASADGRFVEVNASCCRLMGRTREEMLALTIPEVVAPSEVDKVPEQMARLFAGELIVIEQDIVHKDGTTITIEVRAKQLPSGYLQGIVRDVSERKRAADEIARQKEFIEALVESSTDGILAFDREHRLTVWNRGMVRLTGVEAEHVVGNDMFELFPFLKDWGEDERVEAVLRGETVITADRPYLIPQSGAAGWFEACYAPWLGPDGRVLGGLGTIRDITGRRELEERIRSAQKMEAIGRLAGGVAHDFNNLLSVILGEVALATRAPSSLERAQAALAQIQEVAERASDLTRQLLAFSRRRLVEPVVFLVDTVIVQLQPVLRRLVGERTDLVLALDAEGCAIRAGRSQFEQVLANLVVNARDALEERGGVRVSTLCRELTTRNASALGVPPGQYVVLCVEDDGCGMSADVRAHAFEPFFTTKAQGSGTGLGLATCYAVVQQCGGAITLDSIPGQGTTVQVFFPLSDAPPVHVGDSAAAAAPRGDETILLVEDEAKVRDVTARLLRDRGYTVIEASDGLEALDALERTEPAPDLLLTDVVMPNLGGKELARRVLAQKPEIRVLYTTGYTDDADLQRAMRTGELTILEKPYSASQLESRVREVLDRRPPPGPGGQ